MQATLQSADPVTQVSIQSLHMLLVDTCVINWVPFKKGYILVTILDVLFPNLPQFSSRESFSLDSHDQL